MTSERSAPPRCDETSNIRMVSVIHPCSSVRGRSESIPAIDSNQRNSMVTDENTKLMNAIAVSKEKEKIQLLDNIRSCLNAMETTRKAAKHISQLHGNQFSTVVIKEIMNAFYYQQDVRWTTAKCWTIFSNYIQRLFT